MVQPTPLHHANGGSHALIMCSNCGTQLPDENDRAHNLGRFFCKADPEHPQDSCLLEWRGRQH